MQYRGQRAVAALGIIVAFAVSAIAYSSLPDPMVSHWGVTGSPTAAMSRPWGAFFTPVLTIVVVFLVLAAPAFDPRRRNVAAFRDVYEWFVAGLAWFLAYVHALTLAWNLGYHVPFLVSLAPALAGIYYGIGVLFARARARPNWTIGVRTPWTLDDDAVWERTHDRASIAFKLGALLVLLTLFLPQSAIWFVLAGVLPAAFALAYSFWVYERRHRA